MERVLACMYVCAYVEIFVLSVVHRIAADDPAHVNKQDEVHSGGSLTDSHCKHLPSGFRQSPSAEGGDGQAGGEGPGTGTTAVHHLEALCHQP